jgi:hypothetical protein
MGEHREFGIGFRRFTLPGGRGRMAFGLGNSLLSPVHRVSTMVGGTCEVDASRCREKPSPWELAAETIAVNKRHGA